MNLTSFASIQYFSHTVHLDHLTVQNYTQGSNQSCIFFFFFEAFSSMGYYFFKQSFIGLLTYILKVTKYHRRLFKFLETSMPFLRNTFLWLYVLVKSSQISARIHSESKDGQLSQEIFFTG